MLNGRCRFHGGKTPVGVNASQFQHGRYSKDFPTRLIGRYEQALADPEVSSVREEIAIVEARTAECLAKVDTKEAGAHWIAVRKALDDLETASDAFQQVKAVTEARTACSLALSDYAAWAEVLDLVERRRKLAETETKRLSAMGQQITAEKAMLLLAAVVDIVRRNVTDPVQLKAISREISALAGRED